MVKNIEKKHTQITQRENTESTLWQNHLDEVHQQQLSALVVSKVEEGLLTRLSALAPSSREA
jgi:hypothetical protein